MLTLEGRKAIKLKELERLNPERLKYELVFAPGPGVTYDQLAEVRHFVQEPERVYQSDMAVAMRLKELALGVEPERTTKVILFGSRARGDAQPDSDFDLLVVMRGIAPVEADAFRLALYRAFRGTGVAVEPFVMSEDDFEESRTVVGGIAYPAWSEGVVLYEKP